MTSFRTEQLADGKVTLHCGDCLDVLKTLEPNSIDACVTDPPYHLTSGNAVYDLRLTGAGNPRARRLPKGGFMGKAWDGGDIAFRPETWREVLRVLKPGAYIVAFSSSRTYHRMACAIEDAGFITHPLVAWITGQGFPKATNVSKAIDRIAGAKREIVSIDRTRFTVGRANEHSNSWKSGSEGGDSRPRDDEGYRFDVQTAPATDAAREWEGWYYGTQSLKPAIEPIYCGQKPFERGLNGTQNILKWGCGALNIDGSRIEGDSTVRSQRGTSKAWEGGAFSGDRLNGSTLGRWPANVILSDDEEVRSAFPDNLTSGTGAIKKATGAGTQANAYGKESRAVGTANIEYGDSGSAARFFYQVKKDDASRLFYSAKADAMDRLGSSHPTVKPLNLKQYLCRLVTPPRGTVLDCFAGTGTTGEACIREGFRAILCEREAEYQEDIRRRMKLAMAGPGERVRESIKAKLKDKPIDAGPLFAEAAE